MSNLTFWIIALDLILSWCSQSINDSLVIEDRHWKNFIQSRVQHVYFISLHHLLMRMLVLVEAKTLVFINVQQIVNWEVKLWLGIRTLQQKLFLIDKWMMRITVLQIGSQRHSLLSMDHRQHGRLIRCHWLINHRLFKLNLRSRVHFLHQSSFGSTPLDECVLIIP